MSKLFTILISMIIGAALTIFIGMKMLPGMMIKEIPSPYGMEETLTKIEANAKAAGWKVPGKWKVDFQKNLLKVTKVDVGPNRLLKMCEPKAAAEILSKDELKQLSVMMPCTIAVYQKSDGKTYIGLMNMSILGSLFGETVANLTDDLAPQMDKMITFD